MQEEHGNQFNKLWIKKFIKHSTSRHTQHDGMHELRKFVEILKTT